MHDVLVARIDEGGGRGRAAGGGTLHHGSGRVAHENHAAATPGAAHRNARDLAYDLHDPTGAFDGLHGAASEEPNGAAVGRPCDQRNDLPELRLRSLKRPCLERIEAALPEAQLAVATDAREHEVP